MLVLSWFDTSGADAFAKAIADDLMGRIPVRDIGGQKKMTPDRLRNAHTALIDRARAFARTHNLNWYKKAHLGNTFRWAMLERGYEKEFVDTWTRNLLIAVSKTGASGD